jgi:hypothetical protein
MPSISRLYASILVPVPRSPRPVGHHRVNRMTPRVHESVRGDDASFGLRGVRTTRQETEGR